MSNISLAIYLLVIILAGCLFIWWLRRSLFKVEEQRLKHIEELKGFNVFHGKAPKKFSRIKAQDRVLENTAARFTIIRRTLIFCFFLLWLMALIFPFLGNIPTTIIPVLTAVLAIVIGIAARPFLENIISGVLISLSRPFHIGDTVKVDDHYGTVEDISMTHTFIKRWDWPRYTIPNSCMLNKEFINYSTHNTYLWAYVKFWVAYDADLNKVRNIALGAASSSKYSSGSEPPTFWTTDLSKEGIECWIAAWTKSPSDAWLTRDEVRTKLAMELQGAGIKTHAYRHEWDRL